MDWFASWCVLLVTFGWLAARARRFRASVVAAGALACVALGAGQLAFRSHVARASALRTELDGQLPRQTGAGGYVSSDSCRACHPREHASWHASYHRTMTQEASADSVRGRFDGTALVHEGRTWRLEQRGDGFWARIEVPDEVRSRGFDGGGEQRIVMVTGSHHMQAYWTRGGGGNELVEFPFTWLIDEARWVPRRDTFLLSPDHDKAAAIWNATCVECHATAGQPRLEPDPARPETRVAELGIACEACHGPARAHVEANRDPFRRASLRAADRGDPTIVNPSRLRPERASDVCGQCHAIGCNLPGWKARGLPYRPGGELAQDKPLIVPAELAASPCKEYVEARGDWIESRYWPDGLPRVTGREHSQLTTSACFREGGLSCLGCHSMHDSDPDDQLTRDRQGDEACLSCHGALRAELELHTHHLRGSEGSRCQNCHMPYTTYGLLKAIRSHRIDSPRALVSVETGRPNACNLCHLDKTLDWTARALATWYGHRSVELEADRRQVAESVLLALSGDAGQRALAVWSMGWAPALGASGSDWVAPHVIDRLGDRYAAVRAVAARSMRSLPGFAGFAFDWVGPAPARADAAAQALGAWRARRGAGASARAELLLGQGGELPEPEWDRLAAARDDRPMFLAE